MITKEQVLKHLDELEEKVNKQIIDSAEMEAKETKVKYLQVELETVRAEYERKLEGYRDLDKALQKIVVSNIAPKGEGSNPTSGGTVNTTLVDWKHVIHVPVKENEVTIDTSTNRGKILRLAAKGFFKEWRKAGDVSSELERRGQAMHDKVVMMELANLCNLGYLGRTKRENQFVYKVPDEGVVFKE